MTASQKRGALILLVVMVLVIGWRGRVAYLEAQKSLPPDQSALSDLPGISSDEPNRAGKEVIRVELNAADTATLQQVKGIGPAYSRRIVTFRETYGGIVDPQQLIAALRLEPDAWLRIEPQVYADTSGEAFLQLRAAAEEKRAWLRSLTAGQKAAHEHSNSDFKAYRPREKNLNGDPVKDNDSPGNPPPSKRQALNVNEADSAALVNIPGVGPRTAQEIIKFRNSVFFIHSPEQIQTLWCVRPENWEKMKDFLLVSGPFEQYPHIPLNTGDVEALAAHKYIRWKDAKLIVAYRDQHGPYQNVDDLRKLHGLEAGRVDLIAPYLKF